jgi:hypothetical protein
MGKSFVSNFGDFYDSTIKQVVSFREIFKENFRSMKLT